MAAWNDLKRSNSTKVKRFTKHFLLRKERRGEWKSSCKEMDQSFWAKVEQKCIRFISARQFKAHVWFKLLTFTWFKWRQRNVLSAKVFFREGEGGVGWGEAGWDKIPTPTLFLRLRATLMSHYQEGIKHKQNPCCSISIIVGIRWVGWFPKRKENAFAVVVAKFLVQPARWER